MSEIGYRFETTSGAGDVARSFAHLQTGEESGVKVVTAGRLMRSRPHGKLAFAELRDWTGGDPAVRARPTSRPISRNSAASRSATGSASSGEVVRTRRGELSVKVASWELLAHARRGFGDKWHGVNDPDIRYRQRELDLWANEGVRDLFLLRSKVVASIRRRLGAAGFVEVETPVLHPVAGGATARPFVTHYNALHTDVYLRIATELYLKRCVVGGTRARLRDRADVPQRRAVAASQPGVHDAGALPGLRRLHRHDGDLRGHRRRAPPRSSSARRCCPTRVASST